MDPEAKIALSELQAVLENRVDHCEFLYSCHSPDEKRWFRCRAYPLPDFEPLVLVIHENITSKMETAVPATDAEKLRASVLEFTALVHNSIDETLIQNLKVAQEITNSDSLWIILESPIGNIVRARVGALAPDDQAAIKIYEYSKRQNQSLTTSRLPVAPSSSSEPENIVNVNTFTMSNNNQIGALCVQGNRELEEYKTVLKLLSETVRIQLEVNLSQEDILIKHITSVCA